MKYVISVLAVLAAPVLYGVLCVPLVSMLMAQNTEMLNDMGDTYDVSLTRQPKAARIPGTVYSIGQILFN